MDIWRIFVSDATHQASMRIETEDSQHYSAGQ